MKTNKYLAIFNTLVLGLMVTACAQEINYERYSLSLEVSPQVYTQDLLSNIEVVPNFLTTAGGLLMKTSEVEIIESSNYRFAKPLVDDLELLLANELLNNDLASKSYYYVLELSQFWGTVEGSAQVGFNLKILNKKGGKELFSKSIQQELDLRQDGYKELAIRLKTGFIQGCQSLFQDFKQK